MKKTTLDSWGPVVRAIIENQTSEQATASIMLLVPQMLQSERSEVPAQAPTPSTSPRLRAVGSKKSGPAASGSQEVDPKTPLAQDDYFTVDQAASFLEIGRERVYQILQRHPEMLPHQRVPGARGGRDEYRIRGRELNVFRGQRQKGKSVVLDVIKDEEKQDGEDDAARTGAY